MFKVEFSKTQLPFIAKNKTGLPINFVPVDQFSGQEFNKNKFGWPRSDVSALMQADSLSMQDRILSRLTILKDDPSLKGKSDDELLKMLIPRSIQSYGEMSAFMDWYERQYGKPLFEPNTDSVKKDDEIETQVTSSPEPASKIE